MIQRLPTNCGDDTCASCVRAGDFIFLGHHGGGQDTDDVAHQMRRTFENMRATLAQVGAGLNDLVQVNLYLRDMRDFRKAVDVFDEYLLNSPPARMTLTTAFVSPHCLCQMDGVAYKPVSY